MKREYIDYVKDILSETEFIEKTIKEIDYQKFLADKKTSHAIVRSLEIIGEAVKKLPPDIKKRYPQQPWAKIAAMRNIIAHEYFGVDLKIVWNTAKERMPQLKETAKKIIEDYDREHL